MRPWVYSIAPFIYARPFEQIRNDICLHNLPVVLVGNGGGYGYGVMGATHHALEDYGCLLVLPLPACLCPGFRRRCQGDYHEPFLGGSSFLLTAWAIRGAERLSHSERMLPGVSCRMAPGWVILVTGCLVGSLWAAVQNTETCPAALALAALRTPRTAAS